MEYEFATGKKNICISGRRSYQEEAGEMIMLTIETENCKQEGE